MSVRIIFEVRQNGRSLDMRLITEATAGASAKEKALGRAARDAMDAFLEEVRGAAEAKGIGWKEGK